MSALQTMITEDHALQVKRLVEAFPDDSRDRAQATNLALEAYAHYDPALHKLRTPNAYAHVGITRPEFFRSVAFDAFLATRNIGLAGRMLDWLIAGTS